MLFGEKGLAVRFDPIKSLWLLAVLLGAPSVPAPIVIAAESADDFASKMPTETEVREAKGRISQAIREAESDAARKLANQEHQRGLEWMQRATELPPVAMPSIQSAPADQTLIDKILGGNNQTSTRETKRPWRLLMFVSSSMPKPSLEARMIDSERTGAPLVLNGFVGKDIQTTAAFITELARANNSEKASWIVDPVAFRNFGITKVPAYVFINTAKTEQICSPSTGDCQYSHDDFDVIYGDVPLRYAVEKMLDQRPSASNLEAVLDVL